MGKHTPPHRLTAARPPRVFGLSPPFPLSSSPPLSASSQPLPLLFPPTGSPPYGSRIDVWTRTYHFCADALELAQLFRRERVIPHVGVHRGGDQKGFLAKLPGAGDAGEKVVGEAAGQLGEGVGRQGGDDNDVGPFSELCVCLMCV